MTGATAIRSSRHMPDFAGVALVDILANGVAMLIIVVADNEMLKSVSLDDIPAYIREYAEQSP